MTDSPPRTLVIALGGHAISRPDDDGTVAAQYVRVEEAMRHIARRVCGGERVVLTHGNGPIVGNIVLRGEVASSLIPPTPLFISDADSEGGIGLMLQQVLGNELRRIGSSCPVATVITQVIVDATDHAFYRPTKPIGPSYSAEEAERLAAERGWAMAEEPRRGWRRVVPSPRPLQVVETGAIDALLERDVVVIAAGGGGVPVVEHGDGSLHGVDAVVDKDWTSAVLGVQLAADLLVILMEADAVYEDWGEPSERRIERLSAGEAEARLADGEFAAGSVGPKVAAAAYFARERGRDAIVCSADELDDALEGTAGTRITP